MESYDPCLYFSGMAVVIFGTIKALFYMVLFFLAYIQEVHHDWFLIVLFAVEEIVCALYIVCNIYLMLGIVRVSKYIMVIDKSMIQKSYLQNNTKHFRPWYVIILIFLILQSIRAFLQFEEIDVFANFITIVYLLICLGIVYNIHSSIKSRTIVIETVIPVLV